MCVCVPSTWNAFQMIAADTTIATAETGVHNRHPTDAGDLSIRHRRNGEAAVVEVRSIH